MPGVLVGNKIDLEKDRQVDKEEGRKCAVEMKMTFLEISLKKCENVNEVFSTLIEKLPYEHDEDPGNMLIQPETEPERKCC